MTLAVAAPYERNTDQVQEAVHHFVRGQQVDVTLEAEVTNGTGTQALPAATMLSVSATSAL